MLVLVVTRIVIVVMRAMIMTMAVRMTMIVVGVRFGLFVYCFTVLMTMGGRRMVHMTNIVLVAVIPVCSCFGWDKFGDILGVFM